MRDWVYDLEMYANVFTMSLVDTTRTVSRKFEVSHRKNDIDKIFAFLDYCHEKGESMYGFNNLGFDYPVLHKLLQLRFDGKLPDDGLEIAQLVWKITQEQIASGKRTGFPFTVPDAEQYVKQVDIYKIHHFDNKAKATSLKLLEFNMRSQTIEDLPFPVGATLTDEQIDKLLNYNMHDVEKTADFCDISKSAIEFRKILSERYGRNFMNHNDTKIGKDYFIMRLEEQGIRTKKKDGDRWVNIQTKRPVIKLKDCLFDYYDFKHPAFIAVKNWFANQRIAETKGVFSELEEHQLGEVAKYAKMEEKRIRIKSGSEEEYPTDTELAEYRKLYPMGWVVKMQLKAKLRGGKFKFSYWYHHRQAKCLNVVVNGFQFDFGTGGIHGSLSETTAKSTKSWRIIDADVESMYPNIGIANEVYPEHLTKKFCVIYSDVFQQRKSYPKGTPENAMLKLALNGVYGDSNNKFSPFYDPMYTMKITVNGQLSLCLLAEKLMDIPELRIIQVNTDGITVAVKREYEDMYHEICKKWQEQVGLKLEFAHYSKMIIRDVNNYIAVYEDGKTKRKGAYQYKDLGWHQNHSALVIKKAAEAKILHDIDIEEFIRSIKDPFDFMLRTKVPRSSRLVMVNADGTETLQQNVCRYYPSKDGGDLVKIMPPLPGDPEKKERRFFTEAGWKVKTCNNMLDFTWDVDYDYYIAEANKLLIGKPTSVEDDSEGDTDGED